MSPIERARRLSRLLQAEFRIDLFSVIVERSFERRLAETIAAAERAAYLRGRESALGSTPPAPVADLLSSGCPAWAATPPSSPTGPPAGEAEATTS